MAQYWFLSVLIAVSYLCNLLVEGYPIEDLVVSLPGQPKVEFSQYAGYVDIDVNHGRSLFYYFVEADHKPQNKPLTLWLNGGPGCSSVGGGAFTELGPFYPTGDGRGVRKNSMSWNRASNLLFIESPAGVGWSYSNTTSDYNIGDEATANDMLSFFLKWFEKFPTYKSRALFLTGESYAGHYIPQLANAILDFNAHSTGYKFNLKGVAIGNPLLNLDRDARAPYDYFWSHGMISDEIGLAITKDCDFDDYTFASPHNVSASCNTAISDANEVVGNYINNYDVILDVCYPSIVEQELRLKKMATKISIGVDVCMSYERKFYFNLPEVQKALHANRTNLPYSWSMCSGVLNYSDTDPNINMLPILKRIVQNRIPVWVFSGDQDSVVPLLGSRTLIRELADDLKFKITVPYGAWFHKGQGNRIHATAKKTLIYRFQKQLKEGVVYNVSLFNVVKNTGEYKTTHHNFKIDIIYDTKFERADNGVVPLTIYNFTTPADIFEDGFDRDYLVDVIGVLTAVGKEREYVKDGVSSKINVIELDNNGYRFQCSLFGQYVDVLNSFLASGDSTNAVVVVLFAKSKIFQRKPVLQNSINATKILFNPEIPEALAFRASVAANEDSPPMVVTELRDTYKVSFEDEMLALTPRATIVDLKNCSEGSAYVVAATVDSMVDSSTWWYSACQCNKKVYPADNMYFCEKCDRHVVNVTPRFCLKLRVRDDTAVSTFVIFDRDATLLLKKSCVELIEASNLTPGEETVPKDITDLVGKKFLFKVEVPGGGSSRFRLSYRVKRVVPDGEMLQKFENSCSEFDKGKDKLRDTADAIGASGVAQDLYNKFEEAEGENCSRTTSSFVVDLSQDTNEVNDNVSADKKDGGAGSKRAFPFEGDENGTPDSMVLKKVIKVEKD